MALAPEILAMIQGLFDIGVDLKKGGSKALLSDADLLAKLEIVFANISNISADVKAVSLSDAPALLGIVISGVENIMAA